MTEQKPDLTLAAMFAIFTAYLFWGCWRSDWHWIWSVWTVLALVLWALLGLGALLWLLSLAEGRKEAGS